MRQRIILVLLALQLVIGCHRATAVPDGGPVDGGDAAPDTESDTGDSDTLSCDMGAFSGDYQIDDPADLAGLAGYTSISGNLDILYCWTCESFAELGCLESIGWNLRVVGNPALEDLAGLDNVAEVVNRISIQHNEGLTGLEGLGSVQSTGANLVVTDNPSLADLGGLAGLTAVGGTVHVEDNPDLPDCAVCELLDQLDEGYGTNVEHNLDDPCTPVPENCP